ncbi:hypothetical protein [Streptomyces buecherae]|uniref:Transposase n=1 Tax=Streptomyces buecherae TaxID=2763006 RepID=A0A7H8N1K1_9ACTN|nr:hypothetical protein [Streptomyces buecherae]QKW48231.1 hypothetical protein HUT08_00230 [Streptomyces buecherae]QKW54099.1 hypothetical protein HUT08_36195 [Streptomyces buecherae]
MSTDQYPRRPGHPAQVLIHYKGQGTVERRYHDFKDPLAVAPVFVQHNRRVAALIQVIRLALLVFCLINGRSDAHSASNRP